MIEALLDLINTGAAIAGVVILILCAVVFAVLGKQSAENYRLYYVSQNEDGQWSVYSEEYRHRSDEEPIEGTTHWVLTTSSEDAALDHAQWLQMQWEGWVTA